jgi:ribonuclease HI
LESLGSLPPRELLARYRRLCEVAGESRESGRPIAFSDRADLYLVERALLLQLEGRSEGRPEASSPTDALPDLAARAAGSAVPAGEPGPSRQTSLFGPADDTVAPSAPRPDGAAMRAGDRTVGKPPVSSGEEIRGATSGPAKVFADGACQGNPGPGGYGVIVRVAGKNDIEMSGGAPNTTNNQMELTGALVGLRQAFQEGASNIAVYSDSEYLVKGMTSWLAGWERKGWKTSTGQPVKNRELWESLSQLARGRSVTWNWVRGHAGHSENERCDELAVAAARQASSQRGNGR